MKERPNKGTFFDVKMHGIQKMTHANSEVNDDDYKEDDLIWKGRLTLVDDKKVDECKAKF